MERKALCKIRPADKRSASGPVRAFYNYCFIYHHLDALSAFACTFIFSTVHNYENQKICKRRVLHSVSGLSIFQTAWDNVEWAGSNEKIHNQERGRSWNWSENNSLLDGVFPHFYRLGYIVICRQKRWLPYSPLREKFVWLSSKYFRTRTIRSFQLPVDFFDWE